MDLIPKIKNLKPRVLLFLAVFISVIMSCVISAAMSYFFNGYIEHEYIITGIVASFIIATFVVYIIIGLTKEIKTGEKDLKKKDKELTQSKSEVSELKGLIPICSKCKKIRDDKGYWNLLESFIEKHSDAFFSHSICPECSNELYGSEEWYRDMKCPISGFTEKTDSKWTMGDSTTTYQVRFSVLGDRILYSCPSGFATTSMTKKSVELAKKIEAFIHKKNTLYVQIENFENLTGFTINARLAYINHFKNRTGIRYLIFFGVSYLDSLSIRLATKFYRFNFSIKIVNSYQEAISLAKDLIKNLDENSSNLNISKSYLVGDHKKIPKKIKIEIQSDPSWNTNVDGYQTKYEIINGNIIHCVAEGSFNSEQIDPMINIQKKLYNKVKHHTQGYHMIADVTKVVVTNYKVRISYIKAQNDFYNKYPFKSLSFYGSSKMLKSAVHLGRPFLKFSMHMGDTLEQILQIIDNESSSLNKENDSPDMRTKDSVEYVDDVLNYLGTLNHEIEFSKLNMVNFASDHPFQPVFKAIDLINNDLDQLAVERQNNEQYKLDMERKLSTVQKMEEMGSLAGGIAHDFNNILSAVLGYAELVKESLPAGSTEISMQEQVIKAGIRAKKLIEQILLFSRQTDREMKPIQPHLMIKEALKLLRSSIPATIEIKQAIPSDLGHILADPTHIHQILMNLCTNSYHAMRETGGVLVVSLLKIEINKDDVTFTDLDLNPGKYLMIEVSDTGSGMDKLTQDQIFNPYFTTKPKGEGTGLGLSVVHGIVKSYGGSIKIYSEPNQGTKICVYFPRVGTSDDNTELQAVEKILIGNEHVLIVDDDKSILDIMKHSLEKLGYQVSAFTSSHEAFSAFRADPDLFDLVITDMTMPQMTGLELAQNVFSIKSQTSIILCTGYSELITKEKAFALGIKAFLFKPVLRKDLSKTIRKVLDNQS